MAGILDALSTGGWVREAKGGKYELHPRASEYLKSGDSGDNIGQGSEIPGQHATAQSPEPVTAGDTSARAVDDSERPSPLVTTLGDNHKRALSCVDVGFDGAVTTVTAHDGYPDGTPEDDRDQDQDQGDDVGMMEWSG